MSRFTKELRVIPKAAWIVAWFANLCFTLPLFLFVGTNGSGDRQMAALGTSAAACARCFLFVVALGCADRIRLRRREAAADAVRNVDAAGDLHS